MSVEDNGSSEMGSGQPMAVGRKLLPPITPGGAPAFVSERQYDAIIRLRERRRRVKEAKERRALRVKKHRPRCPKGHFVRTKGNQEGISGGIMVPFSAHLCFITTNGDQEVANVGSEAQSSSPAIGLYWPFVSSNEGEEKIGEVMYWPVVATSLGEGFYWPFTEYDDNISEAAYGSSKAPISNPVGYLPVVATNDEEENIGKVAYDSILNLASPDPTTLLRIMMGSRYNTDQVSGQFQNVARLQVPDFATLLTIMNNAGYDDAADDGHYDVDKVMTKLQGW